MVVDDKGGAVEKGVSEDEGAHAGSGAVLVSRLSRIGDADVSQLNREGEEGAEVGGDGGGGGTT